MVILMMCIQHKPPYPYYETKAMTLASRLTLLSQGYVTKLALRLSELTAFCPNITATLLALTRAAQCKRIVLEKFASVWYMPTHDRNKKASFLGSSAVNPCWGIFGPLRCRRPLCGFCIEPDDHPGCNSGAFAAGTSN